MGFVKGRSAGFQLGVGTPASDLTQAYVYSDLGQFIGVNTKIGAGAGRDYLYYYTASSSLIRRYTAEGTGFAVDRTYDAHRNLLTTIDSTWTVSLTKFDYAYSAIGQRETATQSGSAFSDYYVPSNYSAVRNTYAYTDRGELQTAKMYGWDAGTAAIKTAELPGRTFEYRFDNASNRTTSGATGNSSLGDDEYETNGANQYTRHKFKRLRAAGTAPIDATVAAGTGSIPVAKVDRAWGVDMIPGNGTYSVSGMLLMYVAKAGAGTAGADLLHSGASDTDRPYIVPVSSYVPEYDDAGNLTKDGIWGYVYDAENRLIIMETRSDMMGSGKIATTDARRLEFAYDYADRRVQKRVLTWNGSSFGTEILKRRYLYDGNNLVAEFNAVSTLALIRSYTWSLDLAGSLDATGGVGALVQIDDFSGSAKAYTLSYDGNGNVVSLVNLSSGAFAAVYEYTPSGEALRAEIIDSTVADNPFRFSTKFTDRETGLVYYGRRFYSPMLGRFINRDPIEEAGGLNLYGFCGNDGINTIDRLGMDMYLDFTPWGPRESMTASGEDLRDAFVRSANNQNWMSYAENAIAGQLAVVTAKALNRLEVARANGSIFPIGTSGGYGVVGTFGQEVESDWQWIAADIAISTGKNVILGSTTFSAGSLWAPNSTAQEAASGSGQKSPAASVPGYMNDPRVRAAVDQAWKDSNPNAPEVPRGQPGSLKQEQGGWIIKNPFLPDLYTVIRIPGGTRDEIQFKGTRPEIGEVVGWFHTHPNTGAEGYDSERIAPGDWNVGNNYAKVPGIIRTPGGIVVIPYPPPKT